MVPLWKSRKFLLLALDVAIGLISYLGGQFLAPEYITQIMTVIGILQPVFVAIIVSVAVEDAALKRAGLFPTKR